MTCIVENEEKDSKIGPSVVNNGEVKIELTKDNSQETLPPDGGWGWCVVFASFMINFVGKNASIKSKYLLILHCWNIAKSGM